MATLTERRKGSVRFLAALSAILATATPVMAQEALTRDEKWVAQLKKMRESGSGKVGVAVVDVQITNIRSNCLPVRFLVGRVVDGKMRNVIAGQHLGLFGAGLDAVKALTAGEYFINSARCEPAPKSWLTLNGPHARFEVRAGEVVNVGTLRLGYQPGRLCGGGTPRRARAPPRPGVIAAVNREFPRVFGQAVNRPMKVTGAETTMRNSSPPLIC